MNKETIEYKSKLIIDSNGIVVGSNFDKYENFTDTIKIDMTKTLVDSINDSLPMEVARYRHSGEAFCEPLLFTVSSVSSRVDGEYNNLDILNVCGIDNNGESVTLSSIYGLYTVEQLIDINHLGVVEKYNELLEENNKLNIENEFTIKLFQNINIHEGELK